MKLAIALLGAAGALAMTAQAHAQVARGVELGVEGYGYRYEESFEDIRVEDEGRFFGISVEYGHAFNNRWTVDARLRVAGGSVDYSANDGARIEDVDQSEGQLDFLFGRAFPTSATSSVVPYVGIGARVLDDRSGGRVADTGQAGYDREVSYSYVPLGAAAVIERRGGGQMAFYGQYNWIVGGEVRTELGDVDPELPTIVLDLEEGHGWEIGAKLTTPLGRGTIGVQPFLRTWDIAQSTSFIASDEEFAIELFEPANQTRELGVRLTYGF